MDFTNITNDKYWCFGTGFTKANGRDIDYKVLKNDLEEIKYYYAAMMFDCNDIGFFIRLLPYSPAKCLFESTDDYEVTKDDFDAFVKSDIFKKFIEVIPEKIQIAIGTLSTVDKKELQANGIKEQDVDKVIDSSLRIMTIVKAGCKAPKMKN